MAKSGFSVFLTFLHVFSVESQFWARHPKMAGRPPTNAYGAISKKHVFFVAYLYKQTFRGTGRDSEKGVFFDREKSAVFWGI